MASRPSATRTGSRRMRSRRCSDSVAWRRKPPTNTRKRSTAGRSSSRSPDVNGAITTMKVVLYFAGDVVLAGSYSDGSADLTRGDCLAHFPRRTGIGSFGRAHPTHSFHAGSRAPDGLVRDLRPAVDSNLWINGGFFAFKREIFD